MTWKFWQKDTPARPVLNDIETALLESIDGEPHRWHLREWQRNKSPAVRADQHGTGISVVSQRAEDLVEGFLDGPAEAECGAFRFGQAFAERWHKAVARRLDEKLAKEAREAADVAGTALRKALGLKT